VIVTLFSPILIYLIVKNAAAMSGALAGAVAWLPPTDPTPILKQLVRSAQNPRGRVSPRMLKAAQVGLVKAPLAYEPFYIAARQAEEAGRPDRAIAIMEEARRRRPSFTPARMQLMAYYAQAERIEPALVEMNLLLRKSTELRQVILPEMLRLLPAAEGREALASMLVTNPEWRGDFFFLAGQKGIKPEDARALYEAVRAKNPKADLAMERELVFQAMVASGDYAGGRSAWLQTLPRAEQPSNAVIFDGSFRGLTGARPFGWTFHDSEIGRAEPARGDGRTYLDVAYFGGRDIVLAEQVLALRPGMHELRASARSRGNVNAAQIYWRVTCLPSETPLGTLDLARAGSQYTKLASRFAVPASGCTGQRLALVAEAGEVASTINLEVTGLELAQ
jgi:hypothetical protein